MTPPLVCCLFAVWDRDGSVWLAICRRGDPSWLAIDVVERLMSCCCKCDELYVLLQILGSSFARVDILVTPSCKCDKGDVCPAVVSCRVDSPLPLPPPRPLLPRGRD